MNVHGLTFQVPIRYSEGHKCNANEAAALQQTFTENIRNNKAKAIKEVVEKAGGADKVDPKEVARLQKEITEYAESYEFYAVTPRTSDPVEAYARKIAFELYKEAIKKNPSIKLKDISPEEREKNITQLLENNPKIRKFAADQIAAQRKLLAG